VSDAGPPDQPADPEPAAEPGGAGARPRWTRIAIPIAGVLLLVLVGIVVWQLASDDSDVGTIEDALEELAKEEQTATTTITPADTVAASAPTSALVESTTATTAETSISSATASTAASTTPTSIAVAPTTTEAPTTSTTGLTTTTTEEPTTTEEAATTTEQPATTEEPTTTEQPSTTEEAATTTEEPTTTEEAATTTEQPTTTTSTPPASPQLPIAPGAIAANAGAFADRWNANAAGTDVPALTDGELTAVENGPTATTFIAPLSKQVGLVGVVRNDDRSVAEALLVWIPGGDEPSSNQVYQQAFDVLAQTVSPGLNAEDRAQLAADLGLSPQAPPFPAGERATAEALPDRYARFVHPTSASDATTVISVVDARPR
jgi:hypothetical protein